MTDTVLFMERVRQNKLLAPAVERALQFKVPEEQIRGVIADEHLDVAHLHEYVEDLILDQLAGSETPHAKLAARSMDEHLDVFAKACNEAAAKAGFLDDIDPTDARHLASMVALIGSENSELLESIRPAEPKMSDKLPGITNEAEEIADLIIRAAQYAGFRGIPIGRVIIQKMAYNATRGYRFGSKRF